MTPMLSPYRSIVTERVAAPTVPAHLQDVWEMCLDEADYKIAANDHWNRSAPAVVSITDTRGAVWIGWCPVDYRHHLAAGTLTAYHGKNAPAWMLTASVDVAVPLWCRDGLVRARRSKNCLQHPGTWQHATIESVEVDELDMFDPVATARRSLSEELGLNPDNVTFDTAFYSREHRDGWHLTFHTPAYCDLSYKDLENIWQDAAHRWDTDDLQLAPPGPWNDQLPGLAHPAPPAAWQQRCEPYTHTPGQKPTHNTGRG